MAHREDMVYLPPFSESTAKVQRGRGLSGVTQSEARCAQRPLLWCTPPHAMPPPGHPVATVQVASKSHLLHPQNGPISLLSQPGPG